MALRARTLAHVYPAGLEVKVRLDPRVTGGEQRRLDGGAVPVRPDVAVPVLPAGRRRGGHVPREHGAGPPAPHPPAVAELLARGQEAAVPPDQVVPLVAVEVAAEAAHVARPAAGHGQLEKGDAVPQEASA